MSCGEEKHKPVFPHRSPIAVIQIKRNNKWFDTLWVHNDEKGITETVFAPELGVVTGVRVNYLQKKD